MSNEHCGASFPPNATSTSSSTIAIAAVAAAISGRWAHRLVMGLPTLPRVALLGPVWQRPPELTVVRVPCWLLCVCFWYLFIYIYIHIYILIVVIFFSFQQPPFYLSEFWIVTFSFIRATLYRLIVSVAGVDLLRFCLLNSDCVVTRVVVEICISEFFFSYSEFFLNILCGGYWRVLNAELADVTNTITGRKCGLGVFSSALSVCTKNLWNLLCLAFTCARNACDVKASLLLSMTRKMLYTRKVHPSTAHLHT